VQVAWLARGNELENRCNGRKDAACVDVCIVWVLCFARWSQQHDSVTQMAAGEGTSAPASC
jgi:hypothetical protein